MNKRIETLLNNKDAKATDYFELVNVFGYSELVVQKDGEVLCSFNINESILCKNGFELRQKCNDARFTIYNEDIMSISGQMLDGEDTFMIEISMVKGFKAFIFIYHTDTNIKPEYAESYKENDVFSLLDYFNDKSHKVIMAKVNDRFGLEILFKNIKNCTFEEVEEYQYKLHLDDGNGTTVDFPLVDDCINEIYVKEGITSDIILIRTFGQPFMEVSILVSKTEN